MVTLSIILLIIGPLSLLVAQNIVGQQYMLDANIREEVQAMYLLWLGYILSLISGISNLLGVPVPLLLALAQLILLTANMLAIYVLANTAMLRICFAP